jgi:hypothetical protein
MAKIPEFLLKSLYIKGSLRSIDDGFEFKMQNQLGPARIIRAHPLQIDRKPIPLATCFFIHEGSEAGFGDVTVENSVLMRQGEALTVRVQTLALKPGRHTIGIHVEVKDLGPLRFTVSDQLR